MKFYIASRFARIPDVRKITETIEGMGHDVSFDWTQHKSLVPYKNNSVLAKEYAIVDVKGVLDCDVFILLTDIAGTGMYVEFGIALALNIKTGSPKIFVVGNHDNCSFYYHPNVVLKNTVEEVLEEL